jgi:hypothetical protein
MTIEIKQLVIRAIVEQRREQAQPAAPLIRKTPESARVVQPPAKVIDRNALIAECTRQVLRELRKGRER